MIPGGRSGGRFGGRSGVEPGVAPRSLGVDPGGRSGGGGGRSGVDPGSRSGRRSGGRSGGHSGVDLGVDPGSFGGVCLGGHFGGRSGVALGSRSGVCSKVDARRSLRISGRTRATPQIHHRQLPERTWSLGHHQLHRGQICWCYSPPRCAHEPRCESRAFWSATHVSANHKRKAPHASGAKLRSLRSNACGQIHKGLEQGGFAPF